MLRTAGRGAAALVVWAAVAACNLEGPSTPKPSSPLAGLIQASVSDSNGNPPPAQPPTPASPGYFRGTVVGAMVNPTPGADTMATAPRLANVRVTAYPRVGPGADDLGPVAAEVFTNANGAFTLPVLPGGEYAVTFVPPTGSQYRGQWAIATAGASSGDHPWWVVLSIQ